MINKLFCLIFWFFLICKVKFFLFNLIVFKLMWINSFKLLFDIRLIVCFVGKIICILLLNGVWILFCEGLIVILLFIIFLLNIWSGIFDKGVILLVNGVWMIWFNLFVVDLFFVIIIVLFLLFFIVVGFFIIWLFIICCILCLIWLDLGLKIVCILLLIFNILDVFKFFKLGILILDLLLILICRCVI